MAEAIDPAYLLGHEIAQLGKHDKKHGTSYVKTLHAYLRNNMNAKKTAEDLFIHRATMMHRLKRIQEIAGIDFSNHDQVLYLQLSFRLWEQP